MNFNMKFYLKPVLSIIALVILLGYAGCKKGGDPEPSVTDVQLGKLNSVWKVSNVTLDGAPQPSYQDFQLNLSGTAGETTFNYSTTGRPSLSPWPSSGNWSFGENPEQDVIRDKGTNNALDMTYSVTDTNLELSFEYTGAGESGKVKGVWIFSMTK